ALRTMSTVIGIPLTETSGRDTTHSTTDGAASAQPPASGERMSVSAEDQAPGPLSGARIVDLSRLVAGNMVTHVLADLGADVIKVEHPDRGDDLRRWRVNDVEVFWKTYGRNKRSIALD